MSNSKAQRALTTRGERLRTEGPKGKDVSIIPWSVIFKNSALRVVMAKS